MGEGNEVLIQLEPLYIMDTWGPEISFVIQRSQLSRGYVVWITGNLGRHKQSAIERFLLFGGVCYERFYCMSTTGCVNHSKLWDPCVKQ